MTWKTNERNAIKHHLARKETIKEKKKHTHTHTTVKEHCILTSNKIFINNENLSNDEININNDKI